MRNVFHLHRHVLCRCVRKMCHVTIGVPTAIVVIVFTSMWPDRKGDEIAAGASLTQSCALPQSCDVVFTRSHCAANARGIVAHRHIRNPLCVATVARETGECSGWRRRWRWNGRLWSCVGLEGTEPRLHFGPGLTPWCFETRRTTVC